MNALLRRIRYLFLRRRFNQDLDEEMRFHLDMKAHDLGDSGPRRQFGNATRLKEISCEMWGWSWIERLYRDLRYAIRMLRKNLGFTAVAVTTVALVIAANVAVFSFIDALFLRTLNVKEADRLVRIYSTTRNNGYHSLSYPEYTYMRDHATSFAAMAAHYSSAPLYVTAIPGIRRKPADTRTPLNTFGSVPVERVIFSAPVKATSSMNECAPALISANRDGVAPPEMRTSRSGRCH
jgi:hypothetical protein